MLYLAVFASIFLHALIFTYNGAVINTSQSNRTLSVVLNKPMPARPRVINQGSRYVPVDKSVPRRTRVIPDEASQQQLEPVIAAPEMQVPDARQLNHHI